MSVRLCLAHLIYRPAAPEIQIYWNISKKKLMKTVWTILQFLLRFSRHPTKRIRSWDWVIVSQFGKIILIIILHKKNHLLFCCKVIAFGLFAEATLCRGKGKGPSKKWPRQKLSKEQMIETRLLMFRPAAPPPTVSVPPLKCCKNTEMVGARAFEYSESQTTWWLTQTLV